MLFCKTFTAVCCGQLSLHVLVSGVLSHPECFVAFFLSIMVCVHMHMFCNSLLYSTTLYVLTVVPRVFDRCL